MVRIDLIKLTDDIASCSYFPENNQEWGDGIVTINRKTGEITIGKKDDCGTGFYIGHVIPYLMEHAKQGDYKKSVILAWYSLCDKKGLNDYKISGY